MYSSQIQNKSILLPPEMLAQLHFQDGQPVMLRLIDEATFAVHLIVSPHSILDERQKEQLQKECEELAQLDLSDAGDEETWLILSNEALRLTEQIIEEGK